MLVAAWVILACIPAYIAQRKGRSAAAFLFYGLVVPPIAIVHAVLMRDNDGSVPCAARALLKCARSRAFLSRSA